MYHIWGYFAGNKEKISVDIFENMMIEKEYIIQEINPL